MKWIALALTAALFGSVPLAAASVLPAKVIGKVSGGIGGLHATGFLVGQCEVLTVKHAAGWISDPARLRFKFEQSGAGARRTGARVVAQGDLDLVNQWWASDRRGDWMLLKLDDCLGADSGFAELSAGPFERTAFFPLRAPALMTAGFPGAKGHRGTMSFNRACRIRVVAPGAYLNDCHARGGASGSPLFAVSDRGGAGRMTVFAMQVAATSASPTPDRQLVDSIGLPVDQVAPLISQFLTTGR